MAKKDNNNEPSNVPQTTKMGRRNFFKRGFVKVADAGIGALEQRAKQKASHWIRPPFAKTELEFLLDCTRCDACIDICPHKVIFALPVRLGMEVAATPALDILNKGCHLCSDWPCVKACSDNALSFSVISTITESSVEDDIKPPIAGDCPALAIAKINSKQCIAYSGPECGACRDICPIESTLIWNGEKPQINEQTCVGCGQCREVCITSPKAITISTLPNTELTAE